MTTAKDIELDKRIEDFFRAVGQAAGSMDAVITLIETGQYARAKAAAMQSKKDFDRAVNAFND